MTLVAFDWLNITTNLVIGILVFVALFMGVVILMQRPKQEGLGAAFGANVTDQVFGARTTNVLQRTTVYLASAFMLLVLALGALNGYAQRLKKAKSLVADPAPAVAPAAPEAPKTQEAPEKTAEPVKETPAPTPAPDAQAPAPAPTPAPGTPAPAPAPSPETPAPANPEKKPETP